MMAGGDMLSESRCAHAPLWFSLISFSDDALSELGNLVKDASVTKDSMCWDLEQLENVVMQILDGEERELDSDDESDDENTSGPAVLS